MTAAHLQPKALKRYLEQLTHVRPSDVARALVFAPSTEKLRLETIRFQALRTVRRTHAKIPDGAEMAPQNEQWVLPLVASALFDDARGEQSRHYACHQSQVDHWRLAVPFLGELPTCPTCSMLWEIAATLAGGDAFGVAA